MDRLESTQFYDLYDYFQIRLYGLQHLRLSLKIFYGTTQHNFIGDVHMTVTDDRTLQKSYFTTMTDTTNLGKLIDDSDMTRLAYAP